MFTDFQRKLKSMVKVPRVGEKHWVLKGSKTIWAPDVGQVVTTKRAFYAAFVGPIPEDIDVKTTCSESGCVFPGHLGLEPSRRKSRPLSMPLQVAAFLDPDSLDEVAPPKAPGVTGYQPKVKPSVLPRGITLATIELVKFLFHEGSTLRQVRLRTKLSGHEVMRIRNGVYDKAAANLRRSGEARRSVEVPDKDSGVQAPTQSDVTREIEVPDGTSEEEANWLRMMNK